MADRIRVEVAYAKPEVQVLLELHVEQGARVKDAIRQSGILERFPEIDIGQAKAGIFGRVTSLDAELSEGDRVEIYRPLLIDPKEARRRRAGR